MIDRLAARDELQDIARALADPEDVARRLGLDGRKEGAGVRALCPVHNGRALSLTRGRDGLLRAKCHGCAEVSGDVFDLVAAANGLDRKRSFHEVKRIAAGLAGVTLRDGRRPSPHTPPPRRPPPPPRPVVPALADATFDALVAPLLHLGALDGGAHAADVVAYLEGRGLRRVAAADGWGALPPLQHQAGLLQFLAEAFTVEALACSGLVPADVEPDPVKHPHRLTVGGVAFGAHVGRFVLGAARLLIPWRDPSGAVYTLQRRVVADGSKDGPRYVFPSGPARRGRWPFGVERLAAADASTPIAWVEGAVDVLALRRIDEAHGIRRVVLGLPGVEGWRDEWESLCAGRPVHLALDRDGPGGDCAKRIAAVASRVGATAIQVHAPPLGAKDWGAALQADRSLYQ